MFVIETLWAVVLFAITVFGAGAAMAPRQERDPVLRFVLGVVFAFGVYFVIGFAGFAVHAPNRLTALITAVVVAGVIVARRDTARETLVAAGVGELLGAWLIFAAWAVGLLALVITYSGGTWAVDWVEHWQRTVFFLERQPTSTEFAVIYPLTARPPLANILTALWLEGTSRTFAEYQLFMTLFGTLVLLPAWTLVRRWTPRPAARWWLVLALLACPAVAQNLTFTWTKLPAAFFILTGLSALLGPGAEHRPRFSRVAALCFGLGMLTHYSTGPWIFSAFAALVIAARAQWRNAAFWRSAGEFVLVVTAVVGLWVGWAMATFGWKNTVAANSTAAGWSSQTAVQRMTVPLQNLFDTLVPFPFRGGSPDATTTQMSALGKLRDGAFNVYQVNLPLAVGFAGLWILTLLAFRSNRPPIDNNRATPRERAFYWLLVPLSIVTGVVVHTPRDAWGLTHICLQPLVLLALARVAAALAESPRRHRQWWGILAAIDFALGIALHFAIESWALAPVVAPNGNPWTYVRQFARSATVNANDKWAFGFQFFADRLHAPTALVALWLALVVTFVIVRIRSTPSAPAAV